MAEWLTAIPHAPPEHLASVAGRLIVAMLLGGVVAWIHRKTRGRDETSQSFTVTLVLLSILIAMVTQVVGDNVARAFSLVGALSIVRFRTVVRDTQDTAYVIFAVVIGMAMGASNVVVALCGLCVVAIAAFVLRSKNAPAEPMDPESLPFELAVRVAIGSTTEALVAETLDRLRITRRLFAASTARQGLSIDLVYRAALEDGAAAPLINALNSLDGVQSVEVRREPVSA